MGNKISTYTAITTLANGDKMDWSKDMGAGVYATRSITYANFLVELQTDMTFSYANITPMTSSQLASIISDETGSGALVFATSPTLVTPILGAATATSINGNIFSGAINSTWNLSNNKTFTVSNTISFSGTDGTSFIFPSGNGTIARLSDIPTPTNLGNANLTADANTRTYTLFGSTSSQSLSILKGSGGELAKFIGDGEINLGSSTSFVRPKIFLDSTLTDQFTVYRGASTVIFNINPTAYTSEFSGTSSRLIQMAPNGNGVVTYNNDGGIWMYTTGGTLRGGFTLQSSAGSFFLNNAAGTRIFQFDSGNNYSASNCNVSIGVPYSTIPTQRLIVRGSGTSTAITTLIENSSSALIARFRDDKNVTLGGSLELSAISTYTAASVTLGIEYTALCDATSNNITVNLPAASGVTGRIYNIKKIDASANTVTIDANASETIDGATTQVITTQWTNLTIQSNGTNWFII